MELREVISKRRSYRSIEPFEVTGEIIEDLAEAAGLAPSCFNNQPWRFVFVYSREQIQKMNDAVSSGNKWAHNSGMYIAVISKKDLDCVVKDREYYLFDTGMAFAQLSLRAVDLGLVVHAMAGFDEKMVKEALNIPEEYTVITVAGVGKKTTEISNDLSEGQRKTELERPPRISLLGLVELEDYLSERLGTNVDIAIKKNLRKRIGKRILDEVVPV